MKIPCYDIRKGNYARLQHWFVAVYQGTIVPTVQQMDDAIAVYHAAVHPYTTQEDTRFNWWIHLFPDLGKYADQLVAVYDFRVADEAMMAWRSANYPLNELGYAAHAAYYYSSLEDQQRLACRPKDIEKLEFIGRLVQEAEDEALDEYYSQKSLLWWRNNPELAAAEMREFEEYSASLERDFNA